ncbi:MAG: diacylglycerol kinase family protein [Bacteroidota bacterium]
MSAKYLVILNPAAAGGKARSRWARVASRFGPGEVEMLETSRAGHARRLASQYAHLHEVVIAAGGDGTIREVASGLADAGSGVLGILPVGTGNDFAHNFDIPSDLAGAVDVLLAGYRTACDLGRVDWEENGSWHTDYFANAIGAGFDAQVALNVDRFKRLGGLPAYAAAIVRTLFSLRMPEAHVLLDGLEVFAGPLLTGGAGNGRRLAGGLFITPDAIVNDRAFDMWLIRDPAVRRILYLLPSLTRGGHVGEPEVFVERGQRLVIESPTGLPVQADGDVLAERAVRIEIELIPGALTVCAPLRFG